MTDATVWRSHECRGWMYRPMLNIFTHLRVNSYCMFFFVLCGCQDLKYKILIKNKKLKPQVKTETEESVDEGEDDDEEEDDEEDEDQQSKAKFWSPRKAGSKTKVSQLSFRKEKWRQTKTVYMNRYRHG